MSYEGANALRKRTLVPRYCVPNGKPFIRLFSAVCARLQTFLIKLAYRVRHRLLDSERTPLVHHSQLIVLAAVASLATVFSGAPAMARGFAQSGNYTGSWPVTVTHSQRSNGTYCLTLNQNSGNGGSASLVIGGQKYPFGTFQIFNGTLVATIQAQGYGQNAGLVFIGKARATIGPGVFDEVYGGEAFEEGALAFGMKGGC